MDRRTNEVDEMRETLCGRTLGDYMIERRIGGGATSDVFLAKQLSLRRSVALKILKDDLANDSIYVKRFLQEARAAARLEHPNIVRIYEVGELFDYGKDNVKRRGSRTPVKTYRFIAQEYLAGMSLAQYLRKNGTTTIRQTFAVIEQIASALKRASELNIVHRDVKPENVLIDSSGFIKVVDFGLAHFAGSSDLSGMTTSFTRTGLALGTPLYMSPEQARGQKLDSRSDLYSLGVTAYRMLAGFVPFYGETPLAVILKHLNERPRSIKDFRPDCPTLLADLVMRMLEKKPSNRPESVDELLEDLQKARREYLVDFSKNPDDESKKGLNNNINNPVIEISPVIDTTIRLAGKKERTEALSDFGDTELVFFQSNAEREAFERTLHTTNLSREWQASVVQLEQKRRGISGIASPHRLGVIGGVLVVAFLIGGGALGVKNMVIASFDREPPLTISKQKTVEEQFVYALQLASADAWKSVGEYFPNDPYWTSRANRQLAVTYVEENNINAAERTFTQIVTDSMTGLDSDSLGIAGLAWVRASKGEYDKASATLAEINAVKPFDGLTELVLTKTLTLFQEKYGEDAPELNLFNRFLRNAEPLHNRVHADKQGGEDHGNDDVREGGGRTSNESKRNFL